MSILLRSSWRGKTYFERSKKIGAKGRGFCVAVAMVFLIVTYCNVQGGYSGAGNIDADPCFLDADYHLLSSSPCIDAGDSNSVPEDVTTDFDGRPRCIDDPFTVDTGYGRDPIVDMGIHEFSCKGDFDGNGRVDDGDFGILFPWWLRTDCGYENNWCNWSDSDRDSNANVDDLKAIVENYLAGSL